MNTLTKKILDKHIKEARILTEMFKKITENNADSNDNNTVCQGTKE